MHFPDWDLPRYFAERLGVLCFHTKCTLVTTATDPSKGVMQDELGPPALAFVKTVCAVLALDSAVEDQLAVLRRNLLKLVHVREYASASEFQVGLLLASPAPYPTGPYPWLMSCVCAFWQHSG